MSSSFHRLALPFAPELRPERWIFILGCYNSGTSLLKSVLAQHPEIAALPARGGVYAEELERAEKYGWTRMWHKCFEKLSMEPGPEARPVAQSIKRKWALVLGGNVTNVLEKSNVDVTRIPFLNAYFRPAYFIYIVRNGYAVAEGIHRKAEPKKWNNPRYQEEYPIGLCAQQWRETDRVVETKGTELDHFLRITYEDFTEDPIRVTRRMTDFLGLAPIYSERINQTWSVHGVHSEIRNMNSKSFNRLSKSDLDAIESTAGSVLDKYGYERPSLFSPRKSDNKKA